MILFEIGRIIRKMDRPMSQRSLSTNLVTILCVLLSACQVTGFSSQGGLAVGVLPPIMSIPADATPTPTPFQPLAPTPTYLPTFIPKATSPALPEPPPARSRDFPPPSEYSYLPIPPPVGLIPQPPGQVNILLLGSDQRPGESIYRTDTILLVTINPDAGRINLTSFPRDLYVYIPGWTMQRINTAQAHGGFETTAMTFEYNLGVRPDHYILINFSAFVDLVDSLGGIDVNVAQGVEEYRSGHGWFYIGPGINHMDGKTALWYVRSRYTTNDFDRNRRQQEVLEAIVDRMLNLYTVAKAPELFEIYAQNVTTDMTFTDLIPLVPLATKINDTSAITRYYIGKGQVSGWITPEGAQVLLPDRKAVLKIMRAALNSP